MKAENTLKSSTKKKTAYLSRLCMTVFTILLILLFFFIMSLVSKIQGTARIVNYAGLIRGKNAAYHQAGDHRKSSGRNDC